MYGNNEIDWLIDMISSEHRYIFIGYACFVASRDQNKNVLFETKVNQRKAFSRESK